MCVSECLSHKCKSGAFFIRFGSSEKKLSAEKVAQHTLASSFQPDSFQIELSEEKRHCITTAYVIFVNTFKNEK